MGDQESLRRSDPLTYEIIGAAIEVHRILGPGLMEGLYEEALCIELEERSLACERQKRIKAIYKGREIGEFFADVIVDNRVVLELKSVSKLAPVHEAQLISYLKLAEIHVGLLINFNVAVLKQGIKRLVV